MSSLKDVIAYILKEYPNKYDLSNARVTKMIYLADWHQAITYKKQITSIQWYFDQYGPFVNDIKTEIAKNLELFYIEDFNNQFGQPRNLFLIKNTNYKINLASEEKTSLNHIINITKPLNWNQFINLVYSTYPVTSSARYSRLDLIKKAAEYTHSALPAK